MRSPLTPLYNACGALAALFLLAIGVLTLTSIVTRLLGVSVPGLSNYAGYCMAASSFLALAYTFQRGGHIRVGLVVEHTRGGARRALELWCLAVGAGLAAYFAYFSVKMVRVSRLINDVSQGPDAMPLWIPQLGMAFGTVMLALALVERLVAVLRGADPAAEPAGPGAG